MFSPLEPKKIWIEEIHVRLADEFEKSSSEDYRVEVNMEVKRKPDAVAFRIALGMTLDRAPDCECRYERIAVRTVGVFDLPEDTPEDLVNKLVPLNCLAILHGFARGVVAQITGLNPGGPFLLPAVNFVETLEKMRLVAEAQATDREPKPTRKPRKAVAGASAKGRRSPARDHN